MPSFDIVCKPDHVELRHAIEQANKEISTRFDFKGSDARIEKNENELIAYADDDFKLSQVRDVLLTKLAKRNVDIRLLKLDEKPEKMSGDKLKQKIIVRSGIETTDAKKIIQLIKDSKVKVTSTIQADTVRVTGAKRDTLQEVIALVKKDFTELPLEFDNFRN